MSILVGKYALIIYLTKRISFYFNPHIYYIIQKKKGMLLNPLRNNCSSPQMYNMQLHRCIIVKI